MIISVLVAGPALLREGLRALLAQEAEFRVVVEGGSEAGILLPDVIVCASPAPEAVREMLGRWPQAKLLVVGELLPPAVSTLIGEGLLGLLPLSTEPDELVWAIRSVAQGRLTLHPVVACALVAHLAGIGQTTAALHSHLTERERDVLQALSLGASDKAIAQQLYLSVRTVQSHLAHLYQKLGVRSRTEAVLVAIRAGWLPDINPTGSREFSKCTEGDPRHSALVPARGV